MDGTLVHEARCWWKRRRRRRRRKRGQMEDCERGRKESRTV